MKLLITFFTTLLFITNINAQSQSNCPQDDAVCVAENLIRHLNRKSAGAVRVQRLINRMNEKCSYYNSACTETFVKRAINQALRNDDTGNNPRPPRNPGNGYISGTYDYTISPYGSCAGAGMRVHVKRKTNRGLDQYQVTYSFRADYGWSNSVTSEWFDQSKTFSWTHGRDNPWFQIRVKRNGAEFVQGDCKGGTNSARGYKTWRIRFN